MSLVDPSVISDEMVADVIEARVRETMAKRVALKRLPATHDAQARMVGHLDVLLDQFNLLTLGR